MSQPDKPRNLDDVWLCATGAMTQAQRAADAARQIAAIRDMQRNGNLHELHIVFRTPSELLPPGMVMVVPMDHDPKPIPLVRPAEHKQDPMPNALIEAVLPALIKELERRMERNLQRSAQSLAQLNGAQP